MATLLFIATILTVVILLIRVIIQLLKHKSCAPALRTIAMILLGYGLLWSIFYFKSSETAIPFGTDVCFDDWCATVTGAERLQTLGTQNPGGQFIVLHIKMTNNARGIAQKPSEPRVHIIDDRGHSRDVSKDGQKALENIAGKQIPIDVRLDLHERLETKLVFDVPKNAKNLKAIIEEGPFITKFLLPGNKEVFVLN